MDIQIENNSTPPPSTMASTISTTNSPKKIDVDTKMSTESTTVKNIVDENNKSETNMEDKKKDDGMELNGGVPSSKDTDNDKKCISSNVDSTSGKRRMSITEETSNCDLKKAKLETAGDAVVDTTTITSSNVTTSSVTTPPVVGNGSTDDKEETAEVETSTKPVATAPAAAASNGKSETVTDGDDLLERLDAIDASSLRKPDLKLDEIDSTDLEKDDLLKRLEEAENGLEGGVSSSVAESKKSTTDVTASGTSDKTDDVKPVDNAPVCDSSADKIVKPVAEENKTESTTTPMEEDDVSTPVVETTDKKDDNLLNENEATDLHAQETAVVTNSPAKTADEQPSASVEEKNVASAESTPTTPAVIEQKETPQPMEVDNLGISDSTVSVNSATDEAILEFSKETTKMDEDEAMPDSSKPIEKEPEPVEEKKVEVSTEATPKPEVSSTPEVSNSSETVVKKETKPVTTQPPTSSPSKEVKTADVVVATSTESDTTKTTESPGSVSKVKTESTDNTSVADTTDSKSEATVSESGSSTERLVQRVKEINGMLVDDEQKPEESVKAEATTPKSTVSSTEPEVVESVYAVRILLEKDDVKYLCIDRNESTENGNETSPTSSSTVSTKEFPADCITKSFTGVTNLCNFMINQFTELKRKNQKVTQNVSTPKSRGRPTNAEKKTQEDDDSKTGGRGGGKRGGAGSRNSTPVKSNAKSDFLVPPTTPSSSGGGSSSTDSKVGVIVLAKWVDRMYYAGKVTDCKPGNKYVVRFEDGMKKTLGPEAIVFGDEEVLPLIDQSVHAMIGDEEYEMGLVTTYEIENGTTYYTVICETKTVRVTSADIYLNDEQAKIIQNIYKETSSTTSPSGDKTPSESKRPHRSTMAKTEANIAAFTKASGGRGRGGAAAKTSEAKTPEAGFSGGVSGAGGKRGARGKGRRIQQNTSECSDISDQMETDSMPNSPDSALEAIDGVQPELQKTPKESQINSSA